VRERKGEGERIKQSGPILIVIRLVKVAFGTKFEVSETSTCQICDGQKAFIDLSPVGDEFLAQLRNDGS
jgi:hypothetical protein